jgi:CubicO group peptidase (beta-lactamase class C family)
MSRALKLLNELLENIVPDDATKERQISIITNLLAKYPIIIDPFLANQVSKDDVNWTDFFHENANVIYIVNGIDAFNVTGISSIKEKYASFVTEKSMVAQHLMGIPSITIDSLDIQNGPITTGIANSVQKFYAYYEDANPNENFFGNYHATCEYFPEQGWKCIKFTIDQKASNNQDIRTTHIFTQKQIESIKQQGETIKSTFNLKHFQILYGNAFTGIQHHEVYGNQADGTVLTKDNYMRWMSMTKIIGGLIAAKAMEDGIINIDDEIKVYLPQMAAANLKVVNATSDGENQCTTEITIRHLLKMEAGYLYDFWDYGALVGLESLYPQKAYISQNYGPTLGGITSFFTGNTQYSIDDFAAKVATLPLLHEPGTASYYGIEFSILGLVLTKALNMKGYNMNAVQYTKTKLFEPLGMTKTWFNMGQSEIPSDAETKLADVFVTRTNTYGTIDTTVSDYLGVPTYIKDVPGDSWNNLSASYLQPLNTSATYAGNFGWGCAGPLTDFVKVLILIANKGMYNENRVIGESAINFLLTTSSDKVLLSLPNIPSNGEKWSAGFTRIETSNGDKTFPLSNNSFITWGGYYGTTYTLDVNTGIYSVYGTQSPVNDDGGYAFGSTAFRELDRRVLSYMN